MRGQASATRRPTIIYVLELKRVTELARSQQSEISCRNRVSEVKSLSDRMQLDDFETRCIQLQNVYNYWS